MPTSTPELLMRYQWESYYGVPAESPSSDPTYSLIGEGFTSFSLAKNAQELSVHYVHEKTERTEVTGYAPSVSFSLNAVTEDPVALDVMEIFDTEAIGTATHRYIISVNLWEEVKVDTATEYKAEKRKYSVIPDGKGDGTDVLIYTGTMKAASDVEYGTFNRTTKAFTPNAPPSP